MFKINYENQTNWMICDEWWHKYTRPAVPNKPTICFLKPPEKRLFGEEYHASSGLSQVFTFWDLRVFDVVELFLIQLIPILFFFLLEILLEYCWGFATLPSEIVKMLFTPVSTADGGSTRASPRLGSASLYWELCL